MKPKHFLLPVFTGLISSIWLVSQRHSITTLEKENADLEKRIAAHPAAHPDVSATQTSRTKTVTAQTGKIDWKAVAAMLENTERDGGAGDVRTMVRFQQRLRAMTSDEILVAIEEVPRLGLNKETQSAIEQMLIGSLVQKDPQLTLERFIDSVNESDGRLSGSLSDAFRQLAEKDPAQMTLWLDEQIKTGKLESKALNGHSNSRFLFEGALIGILLKSDEKTASARLAEFPDKQRSQMINYLRLDSDSQYLPFAKLVRETLPENEQTDAMFRPLLNFRSGDAYSKATEYLNRIEATPQERAVAVEKLASSRFHTLSNKQKLTPADVESMREWAYNQSPETTDHVTGKALASAVQHNREKSFSEAAELAVQYHESTGNDVVLSTFLENSRLRQHREESRSLAEKISDPTLREKILQKLK